MYQFKVGDRVRFKGMGDACHAKLPQSYPEDGTIGIVLTTCTINGEAYVQWSEGSTSAKDMWWAFPECLEVVEDDAP